MSLKVTALAALLAAAGAAAPSGHGASLLAAHLCPAGAAADLAPEPFRVVQRLPSSIATSHSALVVTAADRERGPTGCRSLVAKADGAVELVLACGPEGVAAEALASAPAGATVVPLPSTACALVALSGKRGRGWGGVAEAFRAVTELAATAGLTVDALVLPESVVRGGSANLVATGNKTASQADFRDVKDEVVKGVASENSYRTLLEQLTGAVGVTLPDGKPWTIKSRNTYQAEQSLVAGEWIADWLTTNADLETSLRQFECCGGTIARNVVARLPGSGSGASEVVVVGAHMDSLPTGELAPGAVDNGSGTVGMLVLAKEFAKYSWNRTIEFVAFGAEEQGIHGSAEYVRRAQEDGVNVVAALCMDMIAYSNRYFGVTVEGTRDTKIKELMRLVEDNTRQFAPKLQIRLSDNSFGSDHVSFQRANIPAILAIELDDTNYPHYHKATDTVAQTNSEQAVDIVKGLAATLVDLAGDDDSRDGQVAAAAVIKGTLRAAHLPEKAASDEQ